MQRSAQRKPNRSRSAVGMMSCAGLLGGCQHDQPGGAAAGDEVAQQFGELGADLAVGGKQVVGELVDDQDVQGQPAVAGDLAGPVRQQGQVALLHLRWSLAQHLVRDRGVRADVVSAQPAPRRPVRRACRRTGAAARSGRARRWRPAGTGWRSCRPGFPAEQDVAFGQADLEPARRFRPRRPGSGPTATAGRRSGAATAGRTRRAGRGAPGRRRPAGRCRGSGSPARRAVRGRPRSARRRCPGRRRCPRPGRGR